MFSTSSVKGVFFTTLLVITFLCKFAYAATAIPVIVEMEPNNNPEKALEFSAPVILSGSMSGADQDAYLWHISDADALKLWDMTLHGIPEALTGVSIVRVKYGQGSNNNPSTPVILGFDEILNFGIRDGSRPVYKENMFFPAGDYIVGLYQARSGQSFQSPKLKQGLIPLPDSKLILDEVESTAKTKDPAPPINAYRLQIDQGMKVSYSYPKPHGTKETAFKLNLGKSHASVLSGQSWYSLKTDGKTSKPLWSIQGEIMLEHKLIASLYNEKGAEIAKAKSDQYGHYILPNLALEEGQYFVKLQGNNEEPAIRNIRIVETGAVTEGGELEPNDKWLKANTVDLNEPLVAKVDKQSEYDYFKFLVAEEDQEVFNLTLNSSNINSIKFCLLDSNGKSRSCRSGKPPLVLDSLTLNAGLQGLLVSRSKVGDYSISKSKIGKIKSNTELEPNNKLADASVFGKKGLIKGALSKQDIDYFTLNVRQEPQLWRLQAIGSNLDLLTYHPQNGSSGTSVKAESKVKRLRLDNLYLLPGTHQFSLTSREPTKYVLRALPLGPPSSEVEREPNNSYNTAQKIELGNKRIGLLTEYKDADYYRFHLAAKQSIQLDLTSPQDGQFNIDLYWDRGLLKQYALKKGQNLSTRLELEPGDYFLYLKPSITSESEYELTVKQDSNLPVNTDFEPRNDSSVTADTIPESWILKGAVGESRAARDWYRLPVLKESRVINIHSTTKPRFKIVTHDKNEIASKLTKLKGSVWQAELAKGTEAYFYVSGSGEYQIEIKLEGDDATIKSEQSALPIKITILEEDKTVAAYRDEGQQITLEAKLSNESTEAMSLKVEASTSDDKWKPTLDSDSYEVPASGSVIVPVEINVGPSAWPDSPVTFKIQAHDGSNRVNSATTQLLAKRFIPARSPKQFLKIPKEFQGAINVASSALGAKILTESANSGLGYLHDGMVSVGDYFRTNRPIYKYTSPGVIQPIIELASANPVEIIGFSFHPFGLQGTSSAQRNASEVKVELSKDGKNYKHALTTKLSAHTQEQFFLLDKPISAHFARLTLLNSRHHERITLGEWKVLAQPSTLAVLDKTNIALPKLGGHVVWLSPKKPRHSYNKAILTPEKDVASTTDNNGENHAWVIAFNHNRAALLESLNWHYDKKITAKRYTSADIFTSMDSPLGPWKKLATWKIDASEKNTLTLKKPVWARFVKFSAKIDSEQKSYSANLPEQIEIFEARADQALSILGEWGHNASIGPYDLINKPEIASNLNDLPAHTTKEQAKLLELGEAITSQVRLGDYTNWYKVTVPEGKNTIKTTLSGFPAIGATAKLFTMDDKEITFESKKSSPQSHDLEAYAEPGEYYIQVEEPPRSVVFTWDTSGSTIPVRPIIQQAVLSYIKGVKLGLDEAQMLPFGGTFLSRNWLDQPYMLQSILNDYNGAGDSSDAETALIQSANKLRDRKGQKIIVLITDAATTHNPGLWDTLREVRPRILAIGVSSKGNLSPDPATDQDLLQDWAMSSGGYYEYADGIGSVERAYDRISSKIRQPAQYKIVVTTELKESPKPGFLEVVGHSKKKATETIKLPAPTIEVILDASGSMFSEMGKQRRYEVARNVLVDLVDKQLPDNANFGLRVFGHKEAGSCRTDLEIPIKRLNRKAAIKKIKKIAPKSYAKTPIGASLLATIEDLKKAKGEKVVLLITDGKETCDGDPEKAIAKINESGIDARVNIIGFAINDDALEAKFRRWAKAGNGVYQQALDSGALLKSTKQLSARKFTVIGAGGEVIGTYYSNGKPIELPIGVYTVNFGNGLVKKVVIITEKTLTLKAGS